jgi:hypothetical protein
MPRLAMARPSPDKLKLLQKLLADKGIARQAPAAIPRRDRSSDAPLSYGQLRMWFLQQLDPDSSEYNDTLAVRLRGRPLDAELLRRCIAEVVRRHEVLRTSFETVAGHPVQRILPELEVPLRVVDLRGMPAAEAEARREELWQQEAAGAFRLDRPPLIRTTLAVLADDDFELGLTMHHIVSDGVAYAIFFREISALYPVFEAGLPSPLPELPIQFADYAAWERQAVSEEVIERKLPFWRRYLGGALPPLQLPVDRPRAGPSRHRGAFHRLQLEDALFDLLQDCCRRERVTSNWVLLASYFALWHCYSGQTDLVIGTPSSIRGRTELEGLIGFFVQTLILRLDAGGNPTFRELIQRAQRTALEVSMHEEVPFDRLFQAVRPGVSALEAPLIQAWIAPMKALLVPIELPGASSSYRIIDPKNARFDVALILDETAAGLTGYWEYDTDLFDPPTIAAIDRTWQRLLVQVLRHPDTTLALLRDLVDAGGAGRAPSSAGAPPAPARRAPDPRQARRRRG